MLLAGQPSTAPTFKAGAALTHILAVVITIQAIGQFKAFLSPNAPLLRFSTFALHPLLMMVAFCLCAPVGAVSWRVYHDYLGVSHAKVKIFHHVITTAAVVIGWLGMCATSLDSRLPKPHRRARSSSRQPRHVGRAL